MKRHKNAVHNKSSIHVCDTFGKCFFGIDLLSKQIKSHEARTIREQHMCHICGKQYAHGSSLSRHMGIHNVQTNRNSFCEEK